MWRILIVSLLAVAITPAAATATVSPSDRLVQFREQGGFAGLDNRVTVYKDGCVRLSRRTGPAVDKCLTRAEWKLLKHHLKALKIGRSERPPMGADFIKYTLSYKGHKASRYNLTTSWKPVVKDLQKILEKYWAPD